MTNVIKGLNSYLFLLILTLSLLPQPQPLLAQVNVDSSAVLYNNEFLGARSTSLGHTQVSDSYSLEGVHTNPAAFLFNRGNMSVTSGLFYSGYSNIMVEHLSGVLIHNDLHLLAAAITHQHNGSENLSLNTQKDILLEFTQYNFSLYYATKLTSTLGIGGGISGVYGSTEFDSKWAANSNIGFYYTPSPSVSYGLAYSGLGGNSNNLGANLRYTYNDHLASPDRPPGTQITYESLSHQLEIGATFRFPTLTDQPDFTLSFANKKIFGTEGMIYKIGLEFFPTSPVVLRTGYYFRNEGLNGLRAGFGLRAGSAMIDYAFSGAMTGLNGNAHQVSLSFKL